MPLSSRARWWSDFSYSSFSLFIFYRNWRYSSCLCLNSSISCINRCFLLISFTVFLCSRSSDCTWLSRDLDCSSAIRRSRRFSSSSFPSPMKSRFTTIWLISGIRNSRCSCSRGMSCIPAINIIDSWSILCMISSRSTALRVGLLSRFQHFLSTTDEQQKKPNHAEHQQA